MAVAPKIWNISESIPIELFVANPNTGAGQTGLVSSITLTVQRDSDSKFWNGITLFVSSLTTITMTEVDSTNQKGRYRVVFPASLNSSANKYVVHAIVDSPPLFRGAENYEVIVTREGVRLYESEPA